MKTKLIHMNNMNIYVNNATILSITTIDERSAIILDETCFYPQGGGQPCDVGIIKNENLKFIVEEVKNIEGEIFHIGLFEFGHAETGEVVTCIINVDRRILNTRLHSAGHVLDIAISKVLPKLKPIKGYHFPDGPYVEYEGEVSMIDDNLKNEISSECNNIIKQNYLTTIKINTSAIEHGHPLRTIYYGDVGMNCGGTHVYSLSLIGTLFIRKIKKDKSKIKISYELS